MKEQKVLFTDNDRDINEYIDRGWYVKQMVAVSNDGSRGKICFLLEREK